MSVLMDLIAALEQRMSDTVLAWWILIFAVIVFLIVIAVLGVREQVRANRRKKISK